MKKLGQAPSIQQFSQRFLGKDRKPVSNFHSLRAIRRQDRLRAPQWKGRSELALSLSAQPVMSASESFDDLMTRLRDGDEDAKIEIYRRFHGRLVRLARQRLDERVRHLVEPDEVLNSALKSFFARDAAGQFDIEDWNSLWNLIVRITRRKCYRRNEHFLAACRDVNRVERQPADDQDNPVFWQAMAREPSPDEAVAAAETMEQLMRRLPNQLSRDIVSLRLQGYTEVETARLAGCSERTVRRTMALARRKLSEILTSCWR